MGAAHAGQDVADDGAGLFKAWVVIGEDDAVGLGCSDGAHQGALGVVAVAATAENTPQQAAALLGQRAQRVQCFLQCVGGVGVIDHRQRRVLAALALQASGYGLQVAASLDRIGQTQAQGAQCGNHAQQVGDVVVAQNGAAQSLALPIFQNTALQALGA